MLLGRVAKSKIIWIDSEKYEKMKNIWKNCASTTALSFREDLATEWKEK